MDENRQIKKTVDRAQGLLKERKEILSLPPAKALDRIVDFPQPAALVHSFSEEDLHFLIHDIGVEDSLPLLSLASNKQWEYILDIEVWEKDRMNTQSVTNWLDRLLKADPDRFFKWFFDQKTEFIELYLHNNIEVIVREHDQDSSVFGDDFFTLDDIFYIRLTDYPFDPETESRIKNNRDEFLRKFFEHLASYNHVKYQQVLLEASSILPVEAEEEAYRLRNVRLAEKGFLPFDEAIGIYQPLNPQDLEKQDTEYAAWYAEQEPLLPVPFYSAQMLEEDDLFTTSLKRIEVDDVLQRVQIEFAGLCNQVIAADQKVINNREELGTIVKKVGKYLNIGLYRLTKKGQKINPNHAVAMIQKYPLSQIFRVGYGFALELKWRAERWREKCWFAGQGLSLSFWGEEWLGVLGGLLIKKPLFFDNYKTGVLYREFTSTDEIIETNQVLHEIIAFDELLSLMTIKVKPLSSYVLLTYKSFILTLWARHYLNLKDKLVPITLNEFKRFFDNLWTGKGKTRKVKVSMKESFLNWLSDETGLNPYEITQRIGQTLENLFGNIESELGQVPKEDLDPNYIHLFLLKSITGNTEHT